MNRGLKLICAGSLTWIAIVASYDAVFDWADWPWEGDDNSLMLLSILPPLVAVLALLLFKWAAGDDFVAWLKSGQSKLPHIVLGGLLVLSILNSRSAATDAEYARYAISEAVSAADEAKYAANGAASAADEAKYAANGAASIADEAVSAANDAASAANEAKYAANDAVSAANEAEHAANGAASVADEAASAANDAALAAENTKLYCLR